MLNRHSFTVCLTLRRILNRKPRGLRKRKGSPMAIEDIPKIKNRDKRFAEIFVDCYNDDEQDEAMRIYVTDNLEFPFNAVVTRDLKSPKAALKKGDKVRVLDFEDDEEVRKLIMHVEKD